MFVGKKFTFICTIPASLRLWRHVWCHYMISRLMTQSLPPHTICSPNFMLFQILSLSLFHPFKFCLSSVLDRSPMCSSKASDNSNFHVYYLQNPVGSNSHFSTKLDTWPQIQGIVKLLVFPNLFNYLYLPLCLSPNFIEHQVN